MPLESRSLATVDECLHILQFESASGLKSAHKSIALDDWLILKPGLILAQPNQDLLYLVVGIVELYGMEASLKQINRRNVRIRIYRICSVEFLLWLLSSLLMHKEVVLAQDAMIHDHTHVPICARFTHLLGNNFFRVLGHALRRVTFMH